MVDFDCLRRRVLLIVFAKKNSNELKFFLFVEVFCLFVCCVFVIDLYVW